MTKYIKCGGGGLPPQVITDMNTVLNKKFSTSTTYPSTEWADMIEEMTALPEESASGSIAHFTDGADTVPLKTAVFNFTPTQATGTPTPSNPIPIYGHTGLNVVKAGKNLIPIPTETMTSRSVDLIPQSDGTIKLDGTATGGTAVFDIARSLDFYLPAGTYFVNETSSVYSITVYSETNGTATLVKSGGGSFTLSERKKIFVRIGVANGTSTGVFISLQLELGDTATTFVPYTATAYPISWTDTVYGGSVDIISGTGISDYGYLVLDGSEDWDLYSPQYGFVLSIEGMKNGSAMEGYSNFLPTITSSANFGIRFGGALVNNNIYCCRIIGEIEGVTDVETWKTYLSTNNLIICYPLAVPETLTLEPQTINTLEGINNIWNDAGETTIKYAVSGGSCNGIMKFLPIFYPNGKGVKHHGSTF